MSRKRRLMLLLGALWILVCVFLGVESSQARGCWLLLGILPPAILGGIWWLARRFWRQGRVLAFWKLTNVERYQNAMGSRAARRLEARLMNVTNFVGGYYAEDRTNAGLVTYAISEEDALKPLSARLPPPEMRHWYGVKDGVYLDKLYLNSGIADMRAMRRILEEDDFEILGERILEFGCSAGRMIRHLEKEAKANEVWGADLHSAAIHWAQTYLSPPFRFIVNTTSPHLPFEDSYFGLIFAGSVWTHIGELDDLWLLEMRRILRPGGRLYITISDEETLSEIERLAPGHPSIQHVAELDSATSMLSKDWTAFITRTTPWQQRVVYRRDHWIKRISQYLEVKSVTPNAYGWQTGVLLQKATPAAR